VIRSYDTRGIRHILDNNIAAGAAAQLATRSVYNSEESTTDPVTGIKTSPSPPGCS
jgi:hypothetical protein